MLTISEIRHKVEAVEHLALKAAPADGAAYRQLALQWRLVEVEAVFTECLRPSPESWSGGPHEARPGAPAR